MQPQGSASAPKQRTYYFNCIKIYEFNYSLFVKIYSFLPNSPISMASHLTTSQQHKQSQTCSCTLLMVGFREECELNFVVLPFHLRVQ